MAQAVQLNRRLLLAILRAPTSQTGLFCPKTQIFHGIRSISISNPRRNTAFSVSFGEETDRRIQSLDKSPAIKSTTKPKRKRTKKQELDIGQEDGALQTVSSSGKKSLPEPVVIEGSEDYDEPLFIDIGETPPSAASPAAVKQQKTKPRKRKDQKEITNEPEAEETSTLASTDPPANKPTRKLEPWQVQKQALKQKLGGEAWNPRKKLSPDTMDGIRSLHEGDPEKFSTEKLAEQFKVSAEAIRRILKSKWRPSPELMDERRARWARRHDRIWDHKAEIGQRPRRTRDRKPEGPERFEEEMMAKQMLGRLSEQRLNPESTV